MRFARFMPGLLAVSTLLGIAATPAPTNNPASPQRRPGPQRSAPATGSDRLSEELNLTEDQKTKVQAVFDEMRQKVQTAILEARTNADTELHQILSPEQYQKLQDMLQHPPSPQTGPRSSNPQG